MINKTKFYELYNKNSSKNPNREHGPIDAKLILRDLSLPISYYLAKKKVSANTVTLAFIISGILANIFFAVPGLITLIISFILHEIAQLLDCVDGTLSRYHGTYSKYGENFDTLASVVISGTFMLAFGHRLFIETGHETYLVLAGIGAFSKAFEHQLIITKKTFLDSDFIQKLFSKSKAIRYIVYGIESVITEVRLFVLVIILLSLLKSLLNVDLVGLSFAVYVIVALTENFLFSIFVAFNQLQIIEVKEWRGWDKQ